MNASPEKQIEQPPFDACPRCGYALCGLPAEYACPECGLRYDASCGLYRARDPRRTLMMWLVTLVVPCVMLPLAFVISPAPSGLLSLKVLGLIVWLFALVYMGHNLVGDFRRGFGVAVTCEGLIVRLPGQNDGLIPWLDVQEGVVSGPVEID